MCEECRHYPCISSCPNAPEPEPVYICDECEEGIFAGELVYEIGGHKYCETCIDNASYTAEYPEEYEPDPMDIWKAKVEAKMCEEAERMMHHGEL